MVGNYKPRLRSTPMKLEPKTFFANERTFLSWLHMAVTIGSIAAALLGFAATADRYSTYTCLQYSALGVLAELRAPPGGPRANVAAHELWHLWDPHTAFYLRTPVCQSQTVHWPYAIWLSCVRNGQCLCRNGSQGGETASVEVICMILLPLATVLCFYALALFLWRSKMIALTVDGIIDDRRGPLCLAAMVVMALFAILILSVHDLVLTMSTKQQDFQFLMSSFTTA